MPFSLERCAPLALAAVTQCGSAAPGASALSNNTPTMLPRGKQLPSAQETSMPVPPKSAANILTVLLQALSGGSVPALLCGALLLGLALAQGVQSHVTTCSTGALPAGNGGDLIVRGPGNCTVNAGTYQYGNVNIIAGGALVFTDTKIDFWAKSILIENTGSLIAGSTAAPIGTNGGQVTIHLYGPDQGTSGTAQGIPCKTPMTGPLGPCGIPSAIWTANVASQIDPTSCAQNGLPGGVTDCFYQYMPLDYDGGGDPPGYFGYKVLAVSYGGTLQLFGKKGATYATLPVSSSGTSWARLSKDVVPGDPAKVVLDRTVDWQVGDQIVLTSTDYLPGHAEQFTILAVSVSNGITTLTTTKVAYAHNGTTSDTSSVPAGIGPDQDTSVVCSPGQTRCVE